MESLIPLLFSHNGALGLGWVLAIYLLYKHFAAEPIALKALNRNTEALIEFKTLLTERIPRVIERLPRKDGDDNG